MLSYARICIGGSGPPSPQEPSGAFPLCDRPLALVGDVISSGSKQFAPFDLSLTPQERLRTLVKRLCPVFGRLRVSTVLRDHNSPQRRVASRREYESRAASQIGVHIRLFQNPQPFAVWFHMT